MMSRWFPIALPSFDMPTDSGGGGGDAAAVATPPPDDTSTLADHESQFSPDAQRAAPDADDDAPSTRDESGRFKPRHRAASQRADADDVAAINEQTRRIKDAEAKLGADIQRLPNESDRVYNLRRRAELLERQSAAATAPPTPTAPPVSAPRPQAFQPPPPILQQFPSFDAFVAIPGLENATYEDYVDARADWRYQIQRARERDDEQRTSAQRTADERAASYLARIPAAKAKYPDWDTVVTNDANLQPVLFQAILSSQHATDIAYYLGKNPQVRNELNADAPDYSQSAVNAMRRHLDSLVAAATSSNGNGSPSSRTAAGLTGAAPAQPPVTAPRPPTPVRTGSIAAPDTPPGDDDMSLSNHEKHFSPRRR